MSARLVPVFMGLLLSAIASGVWAQPAQAPAPTRDAAFTLRYSFKTSAFLSWLRENSSGASDRDNATGLWRMRLEPTVRAGAATVELAIEQRLMVSSSELGPLGAGVLPATVEAPYRIRQLDWSLASTARAAWRAEIDRAALRLPVGPSNVTIGRQAIGWGRGALFGAVDLFSPFAPLDADREWRRGVDAVRADIKLADRVSFDVVGAFGGSADRSIFAGRLRGYAGRVDLELVGGRRARDSFGGVTSSAAVGNLELHGEVAMFQTPGVTGSAPFGERRSVTKAVAGGSYRIPLGNGLLVYGEYHYSGFGAVSADGIPGLLADRAFQERYLRGDTQILGRQALAVLALYECSPEVLLSSEWLRSPTDGSGVIVPSATLTFGDRWSMLLSGYLPYRGHSAAQRSEFGAAPLALFAQLRVYR